MSKGNRPDQNGTHRAQFDRNKRKIYRTQTICGICGRPVDMSLRYPNPMAKSIDHIIPISKGGHPSDISNLQLAHWECNRQKSNKISMEDIKKNGDLKRASETIPNNVLPQSMNWATYKS